jgi:hypothetical protein
VLFRVTVTGAGCDVGADGTEIDCKSVISLFACRFAPVVHCVVGGAVSSPSFGIALLHGEIEARSVLLTFMRMIWR